MTTPVRNPTDPGTIFTAIRQRLIDNSAFTQSTVFLALDREVAKSLSPSVLYGVIEPAGWRIDEREWAGGGRNNIKTVWDFAVVIMANISLDQGDRAAQWLLNAAGAFAKSTQVMDSLMGYDAVDLDGNGLFTRPIASAGGNVRGKPGTYGEMAINFSVSFVWNMPSDLTSPVY